MKTRRWLIAGLALACAGCATKNTAGYGPQTRAWMAQQKSPQNQAPPAQGMTGEAADRTYQRYLQSFTRPIPEKFERERAGGEGQK